MYVRVCNQRLAGHKNAMNEGSSSDSSGDTLLFACRVCVKYISDVLTYADSTGRSRKHVTTPPHPEADSWLTTQIQIFLVTLAQCLMRVI